MSKHISVEVLKILSNQKSKHISTTKKGKEGKKAFKPQSNWENNPQMYTREYCKTVPSEHLKEAHSVFNPKVKECTDSKKAVTVISTRLQNKGIAGF